MSLKLSVVAASIRRRAERSARAHTTPESAETSPDCTPCVIIGLSAQRLNAGAATLPKAAAVAAEAKDVRNRRRVVTLRGARAPGHEFVSAESPRRVAALSDSQKK
jgi:hypothetical protein